MVLRSHHSTNYSERRTIWQGSFVSEAGSLTPDRYCSLCIGCLSGSASFKTRLASSPAYLADLLQLRPPTRSLRSSDAPLLIVPRTQTALVGGARAFSVAAHALSGTVYRPTSGRGLAVYFQTPSENSFYRSVCVT